MQGPRSDRVSETRAPPPGAIQVSDRQSHADTIAIDTCEMDRRVGVSDDLRQTPAWDENRASPPRL
jgi:hypothetical protein